FARWPSLIRPRWVKVLMFIAVAGAFVASWQVAERLMDLPLPPSWVALGLGAAVWWAGLRGTRFMRREFPMSCLTVGDLLRSFVPQTPRFTNASKFSREEIATRVRRIVIEQFALRESDYREDAEFVKDFGAD
ncbi:MAG: hypothetical protein AB1705_27850, partial [Verrucomicrobiota bacterium]